ncbi:MAG: recombinase family protein [Anaerocolumna sp.]
MKYCLYLRKSRADLEAEAHGEGETLLRHEKMLLDLADRMNLNIAEIYREIVSGETIAARPVMQQLLAEVEHGIWSGVFVMEIERLARGDTIDQGIVAQAFKYANTKIITPLKTYDPGNEFDEEYFEFNLFMSRREFKTINRRIQRGRIASVKEGKFISSIAPFGYNRVKIPYSKGYTLEINEEQAKIVRMIFNWYTVGELQENGSYEKLGSSRIAKKLDSMNLKPLLKDTWSRSSITDILKNPVYIGKIRWQYRKEIKQLRNNVVTTTRPNATEYILVEGLHEPLIAEDIFAKAGQILLKHGQPTVPGNHILRNPLSGIVFCGKCGARLTRLAKTNKTGYDTIKCPNPYCDNISAPLYLVEDVLIKELGLWLKNYKFKWNIEKLALPYAQTIKEKQDNITVSNHQLDKLMEQLEKTYEFLEQGIYSAEVFSGRKEKITKQIDTLELTVKFLHKDLSGLQEKSDRNELLMPKVQHILDIYYNLESASARNELLKDILEKVEYVKTEINKKGKRDNCNFTIDIYPKVVMI